MKIAITGKPDVGKTTIIRIMECEFPKSVVCGYDALEGINHSVFPERKLDFTRRCYIRAVYSLQKEIENNLQNFHSQKLILCDHGSLDLLAAWPDTPESFFEEMKTTQLEELNRYDWVIQINGMEKKYVQSAFCPVHDPRDYWKQHARFLEIPNQKGFSFSYIETAKIIKDILANNSYESIRDSLTESGLKIRKSGFLNL